MMADCQFGEWRPERVQSFWKTKWTSQGVFKESIVSFYNLSRSGSHNIIVTTVAVETGETEHNDYNESEECEPQSGQPEQTVNSSLFKANIFPAETDTVSTVKLHDATHKNHCWISEIQLWRLLM